MQHDNVWDLIFDQLDPYEDGFPSNDKLESVFLMNKAVESGKAFTLWNQKDQIAYYCLLKSNGYKVEPHIFGDTSGPKILKAIKQFPDLIWDSSEVKKIEVNTANSSLIKILPRLGWRKEGIRKWGLIKNDGTTKDLFCYGQVRPEGK